MASLIVDRIGLPFPCIFGKTLSIRWLEADILSARGGKELTYADESVRTSAQMLRYVGVPPDYDLQ